MALAVMFQINYIGYRTERVDDLSQNVHFRNIDFNIYDLFSRFYLNFVSWPLLSQSELLRTSCDILYSKHAYTVRKYYKYKT